MSVVEFVHWKDVSYAFPAACGVKNPMYWQSQDWATETTITCPECARLLRERKAAR